MREKLVYYFQSWGSSGYFSFPAKVVSMGSGDKLNFYPYPAARKLNKAVQG